MKYSINEFGDEPYLLVDTKSLLPSLYRGRNFPSLKGAEEVGFPSSGIGFRISGIFAEENGGQVYGEVGIDFGHYCMFSCGARG
jgi:hypothetical protein